MTESHQIDTPFDPITLRPERLRSVHVIKAEGERFVVCFCGERIKRSIVPHMKKVHAEEWKHWVAVFLDLRSRGLSLKQIRTAHDIVRFLNYRAGSPFYSKVKMLGTGSGKEQEAITQATFVDRLLRFISRDPMNDRDVLKRGKRLSKISGREREREPNLSELVHR